MVVYIRCLGWEVGTLRDFRHREVEEKCQVPTPLPLTPARVSLHDFKASRIQGISLARLHMVAVLPAQSVPERNGNGRKYVTGVELPSSA